MPNLDIIEINEKLLGNARLLASGMSNPQIRKRSLIDMLGINCAISYLQAKKLRIDTRRSIYSIPSLFEEFKISDIYYNNYRIDVITLYKEKTIKIPRIHVEVDVIPDFYFIVQIGSKIKEAKMIGFIEGKSILGCSCDSKFYYPTLDLIFDLKKFIQSTKQSTPTRTLLGKHTDCLGLFLKFIDNDLSNVYKSQLIQHIMNCDSCRSRFIDTMEFENIAKNIRFYPELLKSHEHRLQAGMDVNMNEQINTLEENLNKLNSEEDIQQEEETDEVIQENEVKQETNYYENKQETKPYINKKAIDSIFKEMRNIELPTIKNVIKSKHRHKIIVIFVLLVVFVSLGIISVKSVPDLQDENEMLEQMQEDSDEVSEFEMLYGLDEDNPTHRARKIPKQREVEDFNIQQPIESKPTYSPSVAGVSWEVPESILKKQNYTNFLQQAGKNIKLNLQNELLLVRDVPINRLIAVNIKIASGGEVQSIKLAQTSGSEEIDTSINKVVKDTLRYMKPPAHGIIARPIEISLTIELR